VEGRGGAAVSGAWALAAPLESLSAIARLRQVPGLAICQADGELWLRGSALDESLAKSLRLIPGGRQFAVLDDGQLVAAGCLVPSGRVPEGPWHEMGTWLTLRLPPVLR
jgi:MoxR-vWA-beta-propeller ternary system protein